MTFGWRPGRSALRIADAEPAATGRMRWVPDQMSGLDPAWPGTCLVETMGLEPTTPCLQSRCSSQLSYVPEGPLRLPTTPDHPRHRWHSVHGSGGWGKLVHRQSSGGPRVHKMPGRRELGESDRAP